MPVLLGAVKNKDENKNMKNFTPLLRLSFLQNSFIIYRYRKTYMINNIEFTKTDDISINDYFKNIDFIANFDIKKYKTDNIEAKKRAEKIKKMQPEAMKIFKSLNLDDISKLSLYKQYLKIF
jgi:hypothetical protein